MTALGMQAADFVAPSSGPSAPVRVRPFRPEDAEKWDCFVREQPAGTFFHQLAWKRVIEKTFKHESQYFCGERDGRIVGVAPLFLVSNWMVGRALISLPLASYGGICAEDTAAEQALLEHVKQQARSQSLDYLELRNATGDNLTDFIPNTLYSSFSLPLCGDSQALLKSLPKDIRYMIRKAEKADLSVRRGPEHLHEFYRLFAINMRRLGTPVFPMALFENLLEEFGRQIDVMIVYSGSQPVASSVSFVFKDSMHPYYIGGLPAARDLAANNFLWWELMKFGAERGLRTFDFGRSKKGTGAYAFKKKWNAAITDLKYQVLLVNRKTAPNFSPINPKFELASRVWSRLPLWAANRLGPQVVRLFP